MGRYWLIYAKKGAFNGWSAMCYNTLSESEAAMEFFKKEYAVAALTADNRPLKVLDDGAFGTCPTCETEFNSELVNEYSIRHCHKCGQKLDWDSEDSGVEELSPAHKILAVVDWQRNKNLHPLTCGDCGKSLVTAIKNGQIVLNCECGYMQNNIPDIVLQRYINMYL